MKAVVLKEIGTVQLEETPDPVLQDPQDALVRVTLAGICGSDLHIVQGRDPGIRMGTIMGHEFVGIVEETGSAVQGMKRGDRVLSPFSVNCGKCFYCERNIPARCVRSFCFGFVSEEGNGLEGSQAELVRVPFAPSTLLALPANRTDGSALSDKDALFLGDIFSTAYSTAEGGAIQKGDTVVVVGCGPVGLLCILAAKLFEPANIIAVDSIDYRVAKAREFGAITVDPKPENVLKLVQELTDGRGADAVLEAVGHPSALDLAIHVVRPAGVVSIAGYHTQSTYPFPIQKAYTKNLTLKIGRCSARKYMQKLLPLVLGNRVPLTSIITHILPLSDAVHGYDLFAKRQDNAIKVLLKP
ncbi:alcohol dehydrogenase catalytic domain-containing protein [bacterium]|nr:alcohol dehydrogenase catalytic domain-containing protein [bacterium]